MIADVMTAKGAVWIKIIRNENHLIPLFRRTLSFNRRKEIPDDRNNLNREKRPIWRETERGNENHPEKTQSFANNYKRTTNSHRFGHDIAKSFSDRSNSKTPRTEAEAEAEPDLYSFDEQMSHINRYTIQIKKCLAEGKVEEALQIFFEHIINDLRVRPTAYLYNVLIGFLGRMGDVKRSFQLYRQMTDRDLKCDGSTYTSLFNACANSPDHEEALRRALYLRQKLKMKGYIPNTTNYHAMIKAFGMSNDLPTAFDVADEMLLERHILDSEVLNFLLMTCASDKNAGFIYALKVWQRFQRKGRQFNIYNYNLLLRVVRDCGVGIFENALQSVVTNPPNQPLLESKSSSSASLGRVDLVLQEINNKVTVHLPADRLCILGNLDGFLKHMTRHDVKPDIKTFSLLLEIVPSTEEQDYVLMKTLKDFNVNPDIDFFNLLIKKRNYRRDFYGALNVMELINEFNLIPDIVTFGVLAVGCRTRQECSELLHAMRDAGFRPNQEILGPIIRRSCLRHDWDYVEDLLGMLKEENIYINERILQSIEEGLKRTREIIVKAESSVYPKQHLVKPGLKEGFQRFLAFYKSWGKTAPMEQPVEIVPIAKYLSRK